MATFSLACSPCSYPDPDVQITPPSADSDYQGYMVTLQCHGGMLWLHNLTRDDLRKLRDACDLAMGPEPTVAEERLAASLEKLTRRVEPRDCAGVPLAEQALGTCRQEGCEAPAVERAPYNYCAAHKLPFPF